MTAAVTAYFHLHHHHNIRNITNNNITAICSSLILSTACDCFHAVLVCATPASRIWTYAVLPSVIFSAPASSLPASTPLLRLFLCVCNCCSRHLSRPSSPSLYLQHQQQHHHRHLFIDTTAVSTPFSSLNPSRVQISQIFI